MGDAAKLAAHLAAIRRQNFAVAKLQISFASLVLMELMEYATSL